MTVSVVRLFLSVLILSMLVVPISASSSETLVPVSAAASEIQFTKESSVPGYTVNGIANAETVFAMYGDEVIIKGVGLPSGKVLSAEVRVSGATGSQTLSGSEISIAGFPSSQSFLVLIHLSLIDDPNPPVTPSDPTPPVTPGDPTPPVTPSNPDTPDTPVNPDTPVSPDTPDTPGTDEPYVPILPPAGSVHNVAGFIPLAAGILLLFLVFFWKRKVCRILKHHAKRHGEKPNKKQLRATADALIRVIRSEEYAGWRKDGVLTERLSADIVRTLDEMQYPQVVPRDAVVSEILKSAKSKINRHRL